MASESPGWCKACGQPIEQTARPNGRAKEFCGATCRQRHSREVRLRRALSVEVGLTEKQAGRLLELFTVTPKRDLSASRSAEQKGA